MSLVSPIVIKGIRRSRHDSPRRRDRAATTSATPPAPRRPRRHRRRHRHIVQAGAGRAGFSIPRHPAAKASSAARSALAWTAASTRPTSCSSAAAKANAVRERLSGSVTRPRDTRSPTCRDRARTRVREIEKCVGSCSSGTTLHGAWTRRISTLTKSPAQRPRPNGKAGSPGRPNGSLKPVPMWMPAGWLAQPR